MAQVFQTSGAMTHGVPQSFKSTFILSPQNLKWLDLKDNPLETELAKAAGDCLDEKQCKQCASKVSQVRGRAGEPRQQERSPHGCISVVLGKNGSGCWLGQRN